MKTAFVTGANRGLGKGFVDHLSKEGYDVFAGIKTLTKEFRDIATDISNVPDSD